MAEVPRREDDVPSSSAVELIGERQDSTGKIDAFTSEDEKKRRNDGIPIESANQGTQIRN